MALVEIDETELGQLRGVRDTVAGMLKNPKSRTQLLQAQKLANPNAVIPEIDAPAPFIEALSKTNETLAAVQKQLAEDKEARENEKRLGALDAKWNEGRAKLRARGYTAEAIEKIEKEIMEPKGVADHEIAADHFDKLHPQAEPIAGGNRMIFSDVFSADAKKDGNPLKHLFEGNDEAFLQSVIPETLREVRGQR